jgi:cytochrome bd-type quinol oxidase subunit 2
MKKNLIILFSSIFALSSKVVLAADYSGLVNKGLDDTATEAKLQTTNTDVSAIAGQLIGQVLAFVGVIFFGLVVYGGFKWMTAQGNAKQADEARDTMVRAAIGLIIIFSAYAITAYVGGIAQDPNANL